MKFYFRHYFSAYIDREFDSRKLSQSHNHFPYLNWSTDPEPFE